MRVKLLLTLLCAICCNVIVSAQHRDCGSMEYLEQQLQQDPKRLEKMDAIEKHTSYYIANHSDEQKVAGVITIPVVFHVVYNTASENISDAQINSQLQVLNDDFRRLNSDQTTDWPQADDTEIEFCLATVDPNGAATNGITRTSTSVTSFSTNDNMKFNSSGGKDAWPAGDYLNFWVCDISGGILGYAQFPGGPPSTDGVVCDYQYVGTIGTATAPFDLGRTATHEVGHWLNLRHIWGDGNCNADDFVTDTPTSDAPNYGCATGHVSCSSTDMVENYMDYSDDACMNLYTSGQKTRMRALFDPGGFRVSLLSSGGCGAPAPPTCSDGIQNGNETGVDCGGPDCSPCNPACTDNEVTVTINLDNYPEETSWNITDSGNNVVASGGTYGSEPDGSTVTIDECLANGCYDFTIFDSYGDGICCGYGNGSYTVTSGGSTLASGGNFGSSETTNFCFGGGGPILGCTDPGAHNYNPSATQDDGSCETCSDNVQNGDETGVDCGGALCSPCAVLGCTDSNAHNYDPNATQDDGSCETCNDNIQNGDETGVDCGGSLCNSCGGGGTTTILAHYFESGWDGWQDGGSDCYRYNGSRSWEGTRSIRIRDNSGTASAMTSSAYDLTGYSQVEIEFYFYAHSMENGEDFWVRFYDGSSWNTVATYARGTSFNNGTFYVATVTLQSSSYNFATNSQFRFQCDASGNNDHIYIDAVTVTGTSSTKTDGTDAVTIKELQSLSTDSDIDEDDLRVFPNPTNGLVKVRGEELTSISILTLDGQVILTEACAENGKDLDVSHLAKGLYIIMAKSNEETYYQKMVKE